MIILSDTGGSFTESSFTRIGLLGKISFQRLYGLKLIKSICQLSSIKGTCLFRFRSVHVRNRKYLDMNWDPLLEIFMR